MSLHPLGASCSPNPGMQLTQPSEGRNLEHDSLSAMPMLLYCIGLVRFPQIPLNRRLHIWPHPSAPCVWLLHHVLRSYIAKSCGSRLQHLSIHGARYFTFAATCYISQPDPIRQCIHQKKQENLPTPLRNASGETQYFAYEFRSVLVKRRMAASLDHANIQSGAPRLHHPPHILAVE